MDAWKLICEPRGSDSCAGWLAKNGASDAKIEKTFANWAEIAQFDINDPKDLIKFVTVAYTQAKERKEILNEKETTPSTMLFFNAYLCQDLSIQTSKRAAIMSKENKEKLRPDKRSKDFDYLPSEKIPLAITIIKGEKPKVFRDVTGITVSISFEGYCAHFKNLIGGIPVDFSA
jgi:hypothetical protein